MQTAVNPQTGETAVLIGNEWKKAERIAESEKGEKAYLVGGQWHTASGPASLPVEAAPSAAGVSAEAGKGLLRGASNTAMLVPQGISQALPPLIGQAMRAITERAAQPSRDLVRADPRNEAERFAGTAAEIAGASAAGGGANTARNLVVTGLSSILGATGEQMGGEPGKAAGAVLPAVMDFALTAGRNVPKNMLARRVRETEATEYARRGEEISKRTGIPLSLGQQTGDEATMLVEGMARKNPFSAKEFQEFGAKQVEQAVQRLGKIMDDISPDKVDDIRVGLMVNNAFDDAVSAAVKVRRAQAEKDFGAVEAAGANAKVIGTRNLVAKLDEMVSSYNVPGGGDATAQLVGRMQALRGALAAESKPATSALVDAAGKQIAKPPTPAALTANQTERLLEVYTKASQGKGQIFADLETAQQRMLAGELKGALLADLDEAAATAKGAVAPLLKAARDNYKANSAAITKLEESVLGKYLGTSDRSPERIADFMARAKPTELQQTLDILNKADPAAIPATRRYFIERAVDQAAIAPSQRNPSAPNFSAAKFIDAMPEGTKFEVLFGSSNARQELKSVGEALERMAYRANADGSPTAQHLMSWDAAKRVFTLQGLAGLPAAVIAPRTVARAALTPEGRKALVTLGNYTKPTESVVRAAAYLTHLAREDQSQPATPSRQANLPPQYVERAAVWVASQAGPSGRFETLEQLEQALARTAPQLREPVLRELIQRGRVPQALMQAMEIR